MRDSIKQALQTKWQLVPTYETLDVQQANFEESSANTVTWTVAWAQHFVLVMRSRQACRKKVRRRFKLRSKKVSLTTKLFEFRDRIMRSDVYGQSHAQQPYSKAKNHY